MSEIARQSGSTGALALRFAILTAARTGEVIAATWSEIDLDARLWIIPSARMKGKREHRVPLSGPVSQILNTMAGLRTSSSGYVFPGQRDGKPLSNMSLLAVLKRMGHPDLTTHGSARRFATGLLKPPSSHLRSSKWPSHTQSAARSRPLIGAAICLQNAAN